MTPLHQIEQMAPQIYWLITTSLVQNNYEGRKAQYIRSISKTVEALRGTGVKIIIIENNNTKESFLDSFKDTCDVFVTNNNILDINYGIKEILDVLDCIKHYDMKDDDYIVKQTGRYYLADDCPFLEELKNLEKTNYDVLIKYGWWEKPSMTKVEDCISGLFCMRAGCAKTISTSHVTECAEWRWARITLKIPDSSIKVFPKLGIFIDPAKTGYFLV
jgi:hypothetical protein